MRRLVFYGALAAAVTAAGLTLIVLGGGSDGQSAPAAQPPDNPGDTAPGRPTSTTTEPDPGPTVQQVEIKGRFGKGCSDEGLCYEVSQYSKVRSICDDAGQCVDSADPDGMFPGSQPVFETTISLNGEMLDSQTLMACVLGADQHSFGTGGGAVPDDHGHYRFWGYLPSGTQPVHIDGVTVYQLEVGSPGVGVPSVQIFATGERLDPGGQDPGDFFEEFFEDINSQHQTWEEFAAELRRPVKDHSCTNADWGFPDEQS